MGLSYIFMTGEQRATYYWGRFALGALIVFVASAYFTWSEIRYMIWSERVTASVTSVDPAPLVSKSAVTVRFKFTSSKGAAVSGKQTFRYGNWNDPGDGTIDVLYIAGNPGEVKSADSRQWWAPVVFFGTIAVLIVCVWKWWLSVKDDMKYA